MPIQLHNSVEEVLKKLILNRHIKKLAKWKTMFYYNRQLLRSNETKYNKPRTAKSALYLRLKIVKRGTLRALWNSSWLQNMKKIEGEPLGDLKKFPKKYFKMWFLNSVTVPKNVKGGTLWDFLTSIMLQNVETNEGGPFGAIQKVSKEVA